MIEPLEAVQHGVHSTQEGSLVAFGIRPTGPETGYDYIEFGMQPRPGAQAVHKVVHLIEKRQLEVAKELIADGRHLWSADMFCFTAEKMLAKLTHHEPSIADRSLAAVNEAKRSMSNDGYPANSTTRR